MRGPWLHPTLVNVADLSFARGDWVARSSKKIKLVGICCPFKVLLCA